jgi:hypothetical protein
MLGLFAGSSKADKADQSLPLNELKTYLQFATALNCQKRPPGVSLYQSLGQSGQAFAVIMESRKRGTLENSKTAFTGKQAQSFFANEVAIQLLTACPNQLTASEKKTIESLKQEMLKRRNLKSP